MYKNLDKILEAEPQPQEDESKVKKDCFAYDGSKAGDCRCCALTGLYCKDRKCNFYKPRRR